MGDYVQLTGADLGPRSMNILDKERLLGYSLSSVESSIFLQMPAKHFLQVGEGLGKSTLTSYSLKASNGFA